MKRCAEEPSLVMPTSSSRNGFTRLIVGAIVSIMTISGVVIGLFFYGIAASYKDYDQLAECLSGHGFEVKEGWQHTDIFLEDFGWIFQMPDERGGRQEDWEVQILDGNLARDCGDRIDGIFISSDDYTPEDKRYLSFEHPALVRDLSGEKIETMSDMFARLEWLLAWAKAHPEALLTHKEISPSARYPSLLSPPL